MKVKLDRLFMGLQECLGQGDFEDSFREYLDTDCVESDQFGSFDLNK